MKTGWVRTAVMLAFTCGLLGAVATVRGSGSAYEGDPGTGGVTINGRVLFVGSVPKVERLLVRRDHQFCGETMPDEALGVDQASHGIAAVVISLEGVAKGKPLPKDQTLVIENRTCRFIPRANAVVAGTLEIRNSDSIMHNTHIRKGSRYGDNLVNVVQPAGGRAIQKPLRDPGVLDVRCDAHPFMHASIHVFDHPYFSVTDETGRFQLTQVPPGTYQLRIWHETLGTQEKSFTVSAEGPVTVELQMGSEA